MPRKAKKLVDSVFQIIGGSNVTANVNPTIAHQTNSTPPLTAGFVAPAVDPITSLVILLNTNPYLVGIMYLFLNLSGRFLSMELSKHQEMFLAHPYIRPFILFAVMFVSTRNFGIAFWSTIGFLAVIWVFANENSAYCLIPGWRLSDEEKKKKEEELYQENMKRLQTKDQTQKHTHEEKHKHEEKHEHEDINHAMEQTVHPAEPAKQS
jgi:hypothetical protein